MEMEIIWVFYFCSIFIGLVIGSAKGRPVSGIVWTVLFGPLGILIVALLPNLANIIKCPYCKGDAVKGAVKCKNCGSDLAAVKTVKPIQQPVENYHGYEQVQPAPKAQIVFEPEDGLSSLHKAVIIGDKEIAEMLILNGANLNDRDNKNRTPLMIAMSNQNEEIVTLLQWHGAKQ
jgi:hypothetical protein